MSLLISPPTEILVIESSPPSQILVMQVTPLVLIEIINAIVGKPGKDADITIFYTKDEIGDLLYEMDNRHYDKNEIDFQMENLADLTASKSPLGHIHDYYVGKVEGKSLIDDSEIVRLSTVTNFDESALEQAINDINAEIGDIETVLDTILGGV